MTAGVRQRMPSDETRDAIMTLCARQQTNLLRIGFTTVLRRYLDGDTFATRAIDARIRDRIRAAVDALRHVIETRQNEHILLVGELALHRRRGGGRGG
jgi:sensor domain CHASE-containing protein